MADNPYESNVNNPISFGTDVIDVTPDDDNDLSRVAKGVFHSDSSDASIEIVTVGGTTVTFANLPAYTILPFMVARVKEGGSATAVWAIIDS